MALTSSAIPERRDLEARQLASLRSLLAEVLASNPFYSAKLRAAGLDTNVTSVEAFTAAAPFTSKRELVEDQTKHPPYGSNLTYPLERYTRFSQTSATTGGRPLRWLDTQESWNWMLGTWDKVFETAGVTAADHLFFAFSFGPFLGFWTAFEAAERIGCLCIPGGGMSSGMRLRTILDTAVTVLCCTPTYALRLAEAAAEAKTDLAASRVRSIIVGGEPGGSIAATRAAIEQSWPGARVVDHHGMTEIGPVSYECSVRPCVLHIIESSFIAEVVDPKTGRPAETGELVLTNLGRVGSPLLRYRTGDLVRAASEPRCECGTVDLALEGGILGRVDDMVVVRGINLYPSAVEDVVRSIGGVAEYRVEIHSHRALQEVKIQIEPSPDHADPAGLAGRLEEALSSTLGLRIGVAAVPPGELPRFEMKAKRWVRV